MRKLVILFLFIIYPLFLFSQVDLTTELNKIIGVTNGYGLANKAIILSPNRSIFNINRAAVDSLDVPLILSIASGRLYLAGGYRISGGPGTTFSLYRNSDLIWSYDYADNGYYIIPPTRMISPLTIGGDTAATKPWVISQLTGGVVFTDDILQYDGGLSTFKPHTTLASGIRFYTGTSDPTGTDRLNLNARLYPTGISTASYGGTSGLEVINNTIAAYGAYINNLSSGIGLGINNDYSGTGLSLINSSGGTGLSIENSGVDGMGLIVTNSTTSPGGYFVNSSSGYGVRVDNTSTGSGMYINNTTGSGTGMYINNTGVASSGFTLDGTMGEAGYNQATIYSRGAYSGGLKITTGTGPGVSTGPLLSLEKVKSGINNQYSSFISIVDNPTSSGGIEGAVLEAVIGSTFRTSLYPRVADGPTSVAYLFDTETTLTQGYRSRFMNHGITSTDIEYDGSISVPTGATYKMNNSTIFHVTGTNTAVGDHSNTGKLGDHNTSLGYYSLNDIQAGGINNTVVGSNAGADITTGDYNVAMGYAALFRSTTSSRNVAIGYQTLEDIIFGSDNVAIGYNAASNTTAAANIAIGSSALSANISGSYNIAIGHQSLQQATNRSNNIAIGYQVLNGVLTGSGNIGMGTQALTVTTGEQNIAIGDYAGTSNTTGSRNVFIGGTSGIFNTTGSGILGLGFYAGGYSTTLSNRIYLNTINRESIMGDTTLSPIYILESTTTPLQKIHLNGNVIISDSLRLTNLLDAPEYNHQWLGLTPTGAVYADSLSDAGFMLVMEDLPTLPSLLTDKINGEIKWYYKEGDKIKYSYGLSKLRPTQQIQALMASSEMDKRYIKNLEDKVNSLEGRLNTLEKLLLNKN